MQHDEACTTIIQATSPLGSLRNYCLAWLSGTPVGLSGVNIVRTGCGSHRGGRRFVIHRPRRGLSSYSLVYLRSHTSGVGCCHPCRTNRSTSAPADPKRIGPRGRHRAHDCDRRALDRPKSISKNRRSAIRARNLSEDIYWGLEMV